MRVIGWFAALGGVALAVVLFAAPRFQELSFWRGPQQITAIAAAVVIVYRAAAPGVPVMRSRVMVWLGGRSYGIYLIYIPIRLAMLSALPSVRQSVSTLRRVRAGVALAALFYRHVEEPFLPRKRHFARLEAVRYMRHKRPRVASHMSQRETY
jgi:peptidoglycan/LPS O-acetylase OafA/YrhL